MLIEVSALFQNAINGIMLAGIYALIAVGINLIYGVMKIVNFAHGDFMMFGSLITFGLCTYLGMPPIITIVASLPVLFFLGMTIQKYLVERIFNSSDPEVVSLLLLYGVSLVFTNSMNLWAGTEYKSVSEITGVLMLGPFIISKTRMVAFIMTIIITIILYKVLKATTFGKAIRATSQDADLAHTCGINVRHIRMYTFAIGSALAGISGSLFITIFSLNPEMGQSFLLKGFAIVVIGGLGSYVGAFIGALILGVAETIVGLYINLQIAEMVAYILFIIVLLIKPQGILGGEKS